MVVADAEETVSDVEGWVVLLLHDRIRAFQNAVVKAMDPCKTAWALSKRSNEYKIGTT